MLQYDVHFCIIKINICYTNNSFNQYGYIATTRIIWNAKVKQKYKYNIIINHIMLMLDNCNDQ